MDEHTAPRAAPRCPAAAVAADWLRGAYLALGRHADELKEAGGVIAEACEVLAVPARGETYRAFQDCEAARHVIAHARARIANTLASLGEEV